jgi:hypothetical protein
MADFPHWLTLVLVGVGIVFAAANYFKPTGRAWLAPIDAVLDGPIKIGDPVHVLVILENTGTEPATDVFTAAGGGITMPFSAQEAANQQENGPFGGSAVDGCPNVEPRDGFPTIMPTKTPQRQQAVLNRSMIADEALINGQRTFFAHGCVAYRSGKETHKSEFCYFLGRRIDPATGLRRFQPCLGSFHTN